jgi:hypothetical protein
MNGMDCMDSMDGLATLLVGTAYHNDFNDLGSRVGCAHREVFELWLRLACMEKY